MKSNKMLIYIFTFALILIGVFAFISNISVSSSGPSVASSDVDTGDDAVDGGDKVVSTPDKNCELDEDYYSKNNTEVSGKVDEMKSNIDGHRCYAKEMSNGIYSTVFKFGDKDTGTYVYGYLYSEDVNLVDNVVLKTSKGDKILPSEDSEISENEAILIFELDEIDDDYEILVSDSDETYSVRRKAEECGGTKCAIE